MKKDNKGMTLVELLAVIAILGILAILITPGILTVRSNVLKSSLKSKITSVHNAALDYAEDRVQMIPSDLDLSASISIETQIERKMYSEKDCFNVTIGKLISEGYLSVGSAYTTGGKDSDGKNIKNSGQLINPVTNESLNGKVVCVRYDSKNVMRRSLVAYIIDECDLYESKSEIRECLNCSNIEEVNNHWECRP